MCNTSANLVEILEILAPMMSVTRTKDDILKYMKQVQRLYDEGNMLWSRVWCILLRLLGSEISQKEAINAFLRIVETGFRSVVMQRRCESFHCWKVLLELLALHGEIKKEKRVHLILIPLKGSKAKTLEIAEQKMCIWWNLIQALEETLEEHFDTLENFICFCFGPFSSSNEPLLSYFDAEMPCSPGKL